MKAGTSKALLMFVALAVTLAMVTATWSGLGPSGGHRPFYVVFPGSDLDRPDGLPPYGAGDGPVTEALSPLPDTGGVVGIPSVAELKRLAELEGRQNFTNVLPSSYWYNDLYAMGAAEEVREGDTDHTATPAREVEEADVVKVAGDLLYVLNPYRGLMIFDLGEPDVPRILGRTPVLGNPVDMYIVGGTAYIIMTANNGYWYRFAVRAVSMDAITVPSGAPSPEYYIGTQVLVVDVSDPAAPSTVARFGMQGFATDSRRVGDVLYFVSTYHAWYYTEVEGEPTDLTFVMSLDLSDPEDVSVVDEVSFAGGSNLINVTSSAIFVAQPSSGWWETTASTTITYVDISDPEGIIEVRDCFEVSGVVQDRFQMDYFDGTLRVVSHHWNRGGLGSSDLWVLDVSDPDDLSMLGSLAIDDAGTLMATRFAGERAYTIHLPRSIDPLDVIDLSDPSKPRLTDILEMPGWVTHMEVRGMRIIALGVDDTQGQRVAVTLFDVSDPDNAVMLERVTVVGDHSWSGANFDPKALTVLDDVGLVLVPFSAYFQDAAGDSTRYRTGVQLVEFDLEAGTLSLAGFFEQPDEVLRTRAMNDRLVATSTQYLQVVDATDRDLPFITASIELCPVVEDLRVVGEHAVAVVRGATGDASLRSYALSNLDVLAPVSSVSLGSGVARWYWDGPALHALAWMSEKGSAKFEVTTVDLSGPAHLRALSKIVFPCEEVPYYEGDSSWDYPYYLYGGIGDGLFWRPYWYRSSSGSALLDGGTLAIVHSSTLYVLDLSEGRAPALASRLTIDSSTVVDIEGHGDVLYLTDYTVPDEYKSDPYTGESVGAYRLRMYGLTDPASPVEMAPVNIPGTPVGASPALGLLYTTSGWYTKDGSGYTRTLNVLRLSEGTATMLASYDIGNYSTVEVEDGIAYLVEIDSYVASRFWVGSHLQDVYAQTTNVTVLDLAAGERMVVLGVLSLSGAHYGFAVEDGYGLLTSYDSFSVYVFHASRASGIERLGLYETFPNVVSLDASEGLLYLSQGIYGTSVLDVR